MIYQPHCFKFDDPDATPLLRTSVRLAEKLLSRRSARTVALTPHEHSLAAEVGRADRVLTVPNVSMFTDAPPETAQPVGDRVFMIGRVAPQKDPRFFAELAEAVRRARPSTAFVWVGGGDATLERMLRGAGVEVTGWLSGDEVAHTLKRPGLYAHTAAYEGFPLSVLDAAATGHLVVARQIDALRGSSIPQERTVDELARLIVAILEGDREATESATTAFRQLNENMNPLTQRRALEALYGDFTRAAA